MLGTDPAPVNPGRGKTLYPASRIKRKRRTKAEVDTLRQAIIDTLTAIQPATLRQLFYQLVSRQQTLLEFAERFQPRMLIAVDGSGPAHQRSA